MFQVVTGFISTATTGLRVYVNRFPGRMTLSVGFAAGGSADTAAHLLAPRLAQALGTGVSVSVVNRVGSAGTAAAAWLRAQPPDGNTLMLAEASALAVAPNFREGGHAVDPASVCTPIAMIATTPMLLVTRTQLAGLHTEALLTALRGSPLPFASSGSGSLSHLLARLFMQDAKLGTPESHQPFDSDGAVARAVADGRAAWGFVGLPAALELVQAKALGGIAATGPVRFPAYPFPTLQERGLPAHDRGNWFALIGPPRMAAATVTRLGSAVQVAIGPKQVQLQQTMLNLGLAPWTGPNAPGDATAFLRTQFAGYQSLRKTTGLVLA